MGSRAKVKINASSADQAIVITKASQGTPGLKYFRPIQSIIANGVTNARRRALKKSSTLRRSRPQAQPIITQKKRTMPTQNSQMLRPASHHTPTRLIKKSPRPDRKGTV